MGDVVKQTIEISAPIERVWEVVMDPNRLGEWVSIHRSASDIPAGPLVRGSRFKQEMRLKRVPLKVQWEVTECDPPHEATWRGNAAAGARARIRYSLEENGNGTRFDYENEFELPAGPIGKVAGRAFNAMSGEREARKTLLALKELLENG